MDDAVASLNGTTVRLGDRTALESVTLAIRPGERLAVVGPNGAGKSTLLRALAGDVATGGSTRLAGEDPARQTPAWLARRRAVLEQQPACAWDFRAEEVAGLGSDEAAGRRALAELGAATLVGRRMHALSGGEQRAVHLARCLAQLGDPRGKLLLLDEPTASLDAARAAAIREVSRRVAGAGGAVVLSTHDLSEAARCDRVAVLANGRLIASGEPARTLTPSTTLAAWGVSLSVTVGPDGRVTVTSSN